MNLHRLITNLVKHNFTDLEIYSILISVDKATIEKEINRVKADLQKVDPHKSSQ